MLTNNSLDVTEKNWDLDAILTAIAKLKFQDNKNKNITNIERIILCGLLSGYYPEIIARQFPCDSYDAILKQTWEIYGYLQKIVDQNLKVSGNDVYDVLTLLSYLSATGYKRTAKLLDSSIDKSCEIPRCSLQKITDKAETKLLQSKETLADSNNINSNHKPKLPAEKEAIELITTDSTDNREQPIKPHKNRAIVVKDWESLDINTNYFPSLSRWNTIGGVATISLVGMTAILAGTIKYDVIVKAQATVRPEGEVKLVQAAREGKIKSIQVKENQTVKKGAIIAALDTLELQNEVEQLANDVQQSNLELVQLNDRIDTLETQIAIEKAKGDRIVAATEIELQQIQARSEQEQLTNKAKVKEAVAQLNIAKQEFAQSQTELQSFEANLDSSQAALITARSKRDRHQKILASGAISQEQFEETQLAVQREQANLKSQKSSLLGQKQAIEGRKQQIEVAIAQLSSAHAAGNTDDTAIEIAKHAIEREKAAKDVTVTSYIREKKGLIQQKIEIKKQIFQKQQQIKQLEQKIAQSLLRATADGKILKLNLRNQEQVINYQETIAQIIPDTANLVIKAQIKPQDRERIKIGQLVKLKINSCPYPDYGVLKGQVTSISADTITSSDDKSSYYAVDINPAAKTLVGKNKTCQLRLGASASANIVTNAETPLQLLLRQSRLIIE